MSQLSERLQTAVNVLKPGYDVWDFCCDHGYLGGTAYKSEKFKNIYFVDPVESIIEKLEQRFRQYVFSEKNNSKVYFLKTQGQLINQIVTGNMCIIGVGGLLIYDILDQLSQKKLLKAQRLILGPHRDNEKLLRLIEKNILLHDYQLTENASVIENDRTRVFYIFDFKN